MATELTLRLRFEDDVSDDVDDIAREILYELEALLYSISSVEIVDIEEEV